MKLLQLRQGKTVEVTLSDETELIGTVGQVSSEGNKTAFELTVTEEFEDGSEDDALYVINWDDLRFLKDVTA